MRPDTIDDDDDDALDQIDVDADAAPQRPASRAEQLQARRRLEDLLEARRLQRDLQDEWDLDLDEEQE
ncbi:hypothetical protein OM427_08540 [Halomonas sp. 18H]|uniref:PA3496 family putative envelope integrity protein n=1 Tax=Halomonas almeriensis TaxID=308163 RepID=UPI002231E52A|nr:MULTISPECIES: hypothetical protein [Halomonas]MCW4149575.1 hypothetical protein [Halomonas sp. 18H]MDN3553479.1 hypothetical protein [Halomonas almeriensis]